MRIARTGKNPSSNAASKIPASTVPKFVAGTKFKGVVGPTAANRKARRPAGKSLGVRKLPLILGLGRRFVWAATLQAFHRLGETMTAFSDTFRAEVLRKEIKGEQVNLRKTVTAHRSEIATFKRIGRTWCRSRCPSGGSVQGASPGCRGFRTLRACISVQG